MDRTTNTTLIIGGPNAGKTHFGGQLYGRLSARTEHYRITSPPDDLTIFQDVLGNLNEGKSSGHTHVTSHQTLELEIEDNAGVKSVFSFPDYGGEQVKAIVNDRRVNKIWKEQIDKSNSWMLFIRLDEVIAIEDVVNRGLPDQDVLKNRTEKSEPMSLSDTAFYTELLQIFLYVKKIGIKQRITDPKLTLVLSCWDLLSDGDEKKLPKDVLHEKLPGLFSFIHGTWTEDAYKIIGLSSIEKSLSNNDSDLEFVKKGPENFGYIITEAGEKETDLTFTISTFID
ncbi:TRAFAC clade GTPase domain-containing protein [Olivibacter oleidegradans]|uniref:Double-GTPase 1 domain-containing protein n=1 Tax=Olivibacter oleidegradans TaxID=760123 RepID=A0ABV6HQ36_9SPHI